MRTDFASYRLYAEQRTWRKRERTTTTIEEQRREVSLCAAALPYYAGSVRSAKAEYLLIVGGLCRLH